MATPIVGTGALAKWTKNGGSEVTIGNAKWSLNIKNGVVKTSNTTDGINRAAGLEDYDGTVEGFLDNTTPGTTTIDDQVVVGDYGTLKLYREGTQFWSGTVIITDLVEKTGTEEADSYVISFAKKSGALTKPT